MDNTVSTGYGTIDGIHSVGVPNDEKKCGWSVVVVVVDGVASSSWHGRHFYDECWQLFFADDSLLIVVPPPQMPLVLVSPHFVEFFVIGGVHSPTSLRFWCWDGAMIKWMRDRELSSSSSLLWRMRFGG
jgi:hypothetical protein